MIHILSANKHPRFIYTLNFIFRDYFNIPFTLWDKEETKETPEFHIHYGTTLQPGALNILSHNFLNTSGIINYKPVNAGAPDYFFHPVSTSGFYPHDIFSDIFLLISRYEEYGVTRSDQHGRPLPEENTLFQLGIMDRPLVNNWLETFRLHLNAQFPELLMEKKPFRFISTIDVDNGYDYKGKGFLRSSYGLAKDLLNGRFRRILQRFSVMLNREKDPFDVYDALMDSSAKTGNMLRFFVLSGKRSDRDHNISPYSRAFQKLVQKLARQSLLGLHPSYYSFLKPEVVEKEKTALSQASGAEIRDARNHFLRNTLPDACNMMIASGFSSDWNMGYVGAPGFRAGVAHPFHWYNVKEEMETSLTLYPLMFLEVTYRDYLQQDAAEAKAGILQMIDRVKMSGGTFVAAYHDHTFAKNEINQPWIDLYDELMQYTAS